MAMSALLLAANDILRVSTGRLDAEPVRRKPANPERRQRISESRQTCVADFVSSWQWVLGLTDSSYSFTLCCEGLGVDDEMLREGFVSLMSNPDNARALLIMVQYARNGTVFAGEHPVVHSLAA